MDCVSLLDLLSTIHCWSRATRLEECCNCTQVLPRKWLVSCNNSTERALESHLIEGLVGPSILLSAEWQNLLHRLDFESRFLGNPDCNLAAIPTTLSGCHVLSRATLKNNVFWYVMRYIWEIFKDFWRNISQSPKKVSPRSRYNFSRL